MMFFNLIAVIADAPCRTQKVILPVLRIKAHLTFSIVAEKWKING